MAESASAFSVYKANGVKTGQNGATKKNKPPTSTSAQNGRGRNKASGKETKTESSRAATTVKKPESKPKKTEVPAISKGASKKTATAVPVTTKKSSAKANGTTAGVVKKTNVIPKIKSQILGSHNVDEWVEELLNNNKKLTNEQERRKKQLEKYLMFRMAKFENDNHNHSSNDDGDGSSDDNDEYDSSTDDDGSSNEDDSSSNEEDSSSNEDDSSSNTDSWSDLSSGEENNNDSPNTIASTKEPVAKVSKAQVKRKNVETNNNQLIKNIKLDNSSSTKKNNKTKSKQQQQMPSFDSTKLNAASCPENLLKESSIEIGKKMLQWLLNPLSSEQFFKVNWEKSPCYIQNDAAEKFTRFISFKSIDQMLITNHLEFTTNVDVTTYKNGIRETLNPTGRATPPIVWSHYADGCSIRFLNPHVYLPNLFKLNSTLQEFFHCFVGANAYLTPPNSQGFAPHFDDIEAFVLQVEGRKRWRLYAPLKNNDILPRISSRNFKPDEIGKPIFDQVLTPGDVLYFPRGVIHQACTEPGFHSLHITLSVYQKQSYADFIEKLMPIVLENAIKSKLKLRRGLPLDTFQNLGLVYSGTDTKERTNLQKEIKSLISSVVPSNDEIDAAVDQLAKNYQHEALPPVLNAEEEARSIYGSRNYADANGLCQCDYEFTLRTNVRLLRANILRLVREEDKIKIYFHTENAREYCKYEPNFIEIMRNEAGTIEMLIRSYPAYVGVSQFPLADDCRKIDVATSLWERGLLITEKPFK